MGRSRPGRDVDRTARGPGKLERGGQIQPEAAAGGKVGKKSQNPGEGAAGMADRPTHIQSLAAVKVKLKRNVYSHFDWA